MGYEQPPTTFLNLGYWCRAVASLIFVPLITQSFNSYGPQRFYQKRTDGHRHFRRFHGFGQRRQE